MAKDICAWCKHCKFTSVPLYISGKGGVCEVKNYKFVDPMRRKRFCRKFERKEKADG